MKWFVKSKKFIDGEYLYTHKIKSKEYVRVKFTKFTVGKYYEKDILMSDVIRIYRGKSKLEKLILMLFNKICKTIKNIKL